MVQEEKTKSGMDAVQFLTRMADDAAACAARMRRANRKCAEIECKCAERAVPVREDESWRHWNSERAGAAERLVQLKRLLAAEGYAGSDKWVGELLAETYRVALRYEKEIDLDGRAERCAAEFAAAQKSLQGASARREHGEVAKPLFSAFSEALRRRNEGVDTRRLLGIYIPDEDLQGLNVPEALALAPAVWSEYLTSLRAAR